MNKSSKIILVLAMIIVIALVGGGAYLLIKRQQDSDNKIGELENQIASLTDNKAKNQNNETNNVTKENETNTNEIQKNTTNNSNETPSTNNSTSQKIYNIDITDEDKFKALYYVKDFDSINDITTKDMIQVAGVALYNEFVNIRGTKINEQADGSYEGTSYTVSDVRSVVYAIFGVEITENVSANSILYKNGEYILNPADGDTIPSEIKNLISDVAAGTVYYTYDLYGTNPSTDEYENLGSYQVAISGVNGMIKSKKCNK